MKNINLMNSPLSMGTLLRKVCLFFWKSLFKKNINPASGARATGGWSLLLLVGLLFGGVGDVYGQCPDGLAIQIAQTAAICDGDVAEITVTATSGTFAVGTYNINYSLNGVGNAAIGTVDASNPSVLTFPTGVLTNSMNNGTLVLTNIISISTSGTVCDLTNFMNNSIMLAVNPLPAVPGLTSSDNMICMGENVTFTATPSGFSIYEFFVDNVSTGSGSTATFNTALLTNNQQVTVQVIDVNGCANTSDPITTAVNNLVTASAVSSDTAVCIGEIVNLTGSTISGATMGQWSIAPVPVPAGVMIDGIATMQPDTVTFSTTVPGTYTLILTTTDPMGGCPAVSDSVTIVVSTTKFPTLSDTTVQCDEAIITTPFAVFNCVDTVFAFPASLEQENGTTPETHTFASNGSTTRLIRWFFDDGQGNLFTRSQTITYTADMTPPMAMCTTGTTNLSVDSFGMVVIDPASLAVDTYDNCSVFDSLTFSSSMATVPCDSLNNTFNIDIYVEDAAGNRDTCEASIKIVDTIAPIFFGVPANDTIDCSANILVMPILTAVENCGMVASMKDTLISTRVDTATTAYPDPTTNPAYYNYTITHEWIATDTTGNTDTARQVIVVEDRYGPIINYPDTMIVPATGTACIGSAVLDLGVSVTDNCSDSLKLLQFSTTSTFTTATTTNIADSNNVVTLDTIIGDTTVYIKAIDFSNNTTIDTLTILVMDQGAPIASCATSVSVSIGASGTLILVPADIDQNSRDACSTPTLTLSRDSFACADIGQTFPIVLTATDEDGNIASCTSMVTIQQGNTAPCGSGGGGNNMDCVGFNITSITSTALTATGANDGTATVVGGGASGAYNYQWVLGNLIVGNTATIVGLVPGTYSVTVTDQANANCTMSQTVIVQDAPVIPPTGPRTAQFIICDVAGAPGSIVQVPVKVVGFDNVTSFAMSYNLANTTDAQFVTPNPIGSPAFTAISSGPNTSSRVNVLWVSSTGQTLADSSVIFTISMVLGANNATVPITIGGSGNATALEVAGIVNGQSVFLTGSGVNNNVTIGTGGGGVVDPPTNDPTITGQITVEDLRGVEGANVNVTGGTITSTVTNATGDYGVTVVPNTSYTITPFEDDNHINGVNLGDMIRIARHIARIDFLDSPLQLIAADVNRDGRVNSRDRSEIFQIVLGRESRFDNNTSWRFIPKSHVFPASTLPPNGQPGLSYPESITVNSGEAGMNNLDFWAVKVGDVDSMAIVPFRNTPIATSRSREEMVFKVQDQLIEAGTRIAVPFKANDFTALSGYQMTIDGAATLSLAEVESGALKVSMSNFYQNERQANQLSTVWYTPEAQTVADDETLFTLYFDVQENGHLSDLLAINSEFIEALAIDAQDNHLDIAIEFEAAVLPTTEAVSASFELYQNRPNPFRTTTTIGFNLPTIETATLRVFDLAGRQLHQVTQVYQKGYNEVLVNSSQWTSGVLYYELETATQVARQKMILIE